MHTSDLHFSESNSSRRFVRFKTSEYANYEQYSGFSSAAWTSPLDFSAVLELAVRLLEAQHVALEVFLAGGHLDPEEPFTLDSAREAIGRVEEINSLRVDSGVESFLLQKPREVVVPHFREVAYVHEKTKLSRVTQLMAESGSPLVKANAARIARHLLLDVSLMGE